MDYATLELILGRFDKLDAKIDRALEEHADLSERVVAVETKVEPLIADKAFKTRVDYIKQGISASIGAGLVLAVKSIWHK